MSRCDRLIRDGSLVCVIEGPHTTHVFEASWADDRPRDEEQNR